MLHKSRVAIFACSLLACGRGLSSERLNEVGDPEPLLIGVLRSSEPYSIDAMLSTEDAEKVAWITVPGLPLARGRVELRLISMDDRERTAFTDAVHYIPSSNLVDLKYVLPANLQPGDYELQLSLYLYGRSMRTASGAVAATTVLAVTYHSQRKVDEEEILSDTLTIEGFELNQERLDGRQRQRLTGFLQQFTQIEIIELTITGHSCDQGSSSAKWDISDARARTVEKVVESQFKLDARTNVMSDISPVEVPDAAASYEDIESARLKNRRVVIDLKYRMGGGR